MHSLLSTFALVDARCLQSASVGSRPFIEELIFATPEEGVGSNVDQVSVVSRPCAAGRVFRVAMADELDLPVSMDREDEMSFVVGDADEEDIRSLVSSVV